MVTGDRGVVPTAIPKRAKPAIERLLARCVRNDHGCLVWKGAVNRDGYGRIRLSTWYDGSGLMALTHRVAWEHANGSVPNTLELDHLCKVRACVEVTHLRPVTHQENMKDVDNGWTGRLMTRCQRGHDMTPSNTYVTHRKGRLKRSCRACQLQNRRDLRKRTRQ